jgi:hypothetical protein
MEAARTSETSEDNYFTRQYIPEDNSELHTRRRENLKSHEYLVDSHNYIFLRFLNFTEYIASKGKMIKIAKDVEGSDRCLF